MVGRGLQGLVERADLVGQRIPAETGQRQRGDAVRGEQQGIAAVAADAEGHDWALSNAGEEFVGCRRLAEGHEALQRADLLQDRGELSGQPTTVAQPASERPGASLGWRQASPSSVIDWLVQLFTQLSELRSQAGMLLAQVGEIGPRVQRLAEQHRPARFQQC